MSQPGPAIRNYFSPSWRATKSDLQGYSITSLARMRMDLSRPNRQRLRCARSAAATCRGPGSSPQCQVQRAGLQARQALTRRSVLMAQRVPFIVAELGRDADPFMLHLYARSRSKNGV